ncbi:hypothetical protein ALC57_07086 [Trachymyrmex cornetzi]|uniref:Uncharacterized protein n=1 Tax=Trachymyrmex cornetzi TaxID=471704 RepID=A0A195E680_9HYME|nr:hypothetical protein ALC57_07086 [Trachymyrmex cornetzi]
MMPGATIPGAINLPFVLIFTGPGKTRIISLVYQATPTNLSGRCRDPCRPSTIHCHPEDPPTAIAVGVHARLRDARETLHALEVSHPRVHRVLEPP